MQASSLKSKIRKLLKDGKFTPSEKSKSSGVKNFYNVTSGFTFTKRFDEHYLYWTNGNIIYRDMPVEKQDEETKKIYDYLVSKGFEVHLQYGDTVGRQKAIKLCP